MLEIKDLVKVYKAKGGAEVRALDGVSVRFEEKGMVFLLGKSGSGKSTLLNLCGGLDSPDSGEIIIKGRSSKDFSQSDFDSYRNTFVGFVFQEYNILDEFSVEDNIALALELQGKNKNKQEVAAILQQVELENFAKRKPNTLSGGQKQRVAIARALVKNPEIIMADEPTGALDSNTGKQVFDTLKKLSEEKLVIVVSHDREFAEIYGDSIIELKDGKIISDVTKTKIDAVKTSDNVSFVGEDTISIKRGSKLTSADLNKINAFLASSDEDVIITNGKKEIEDFRKAARIDKEGAREAFRDTDEEKLVAKAYTAEDSRFIRSKLPVRHAIRIGASSMKVKPFRLLFTILLSFVAFTLFGLFSTLAFYNATETALETYLDAGYDTLMLQKEYEYDHVQYENGEETYRYTNTNSTQYTPAELSAHRETYGDATLGIFNYSLDSWSSQKFMPTNVRAGSDYNSTYYAQQLDGFAEVGSAWNGELLTNETNLSALGENDIVISSYTFDSIKEGEFYAVENGEVGKTPVRLVDYDSIVGQKLLFNNYSTNEEVELTVQGVFRCDLPSVYDSIKEGQRPSTEEQMAFEQTFNYGLYRYALVSPAFYEAHLSDFGSNSEENIDYGFEYLNRLLTATPADVSEEDGYYARQISRVNTLPPAHGASPDVAFFDGRTTQSPADGEFVASFRMIGDTLNDLWSQLVSPLFGKIDSLEQRIEDSNFRAAEAIAQAEEYERQAESESDPDYKQDLLMRAEAQWENAQRCEQDAAQAAEELKALKNENGELLQFVRETWDINISFLRDGSYYHYVWNEETQTDEGYTEIADEDDLNAAVEMVLDFIAIVQDREDVTLPLNYALTFDDMGQDVGSFRLVGFFYGNAALQNSDGIYLSQSDYDTILDLADPDSGSNWYSTEETNYVRPDDARYNYIVIPFPASESVLRTLIASDGVTDQKTDTLYTINAPVSAQLSMVNGMIEQLSDIFLYVGITLAAFAMLLLFNFISVSITNKKKEIGILRAVGARSTDVFKIFYSESIIITAICFVLAMVASFVVCGILNNAVAGPIGASIFVFGPLSWLVMLGIAVVTSLIATFLPVYGAAKRKPVESIRAL